MLLKFTLCLVRRSRHALCSEPPGIMLCPREAQAERLAAAAMQSTGEGYPSLPATKALQQVEGREEPGGLAQNSWTKLSLTVHFSFLQQLS